MELNELGTKLRTAFSRAANWLDSLQYGPNFPVDEVRQELERDYVFTEYHPPVIAAAHIGVIPAIHLVSERATGKPVNYWNNEDPASARFRQAYDDAMARYKAGKAAPAAPNGP